MAWIVDLGLLVLAVLLMGYAVYKLMFSADEELRRVDAQQSRHVFERREPERTDRRRGSLPPPNGFERRVASRR